ncbi:ABC-F family ATP-binding cassette domain-containing protein [Marinomonas spartinae]|uniref:ABC-F family ATP-binding cassette domain-containing protein n=1 Tax=Marinomonas spartinae TaxID=1792290 RepID=UPI0018F19CE7|nr:ABC-F family ATP-binding cassette domain-containing protein [Marinomonas spartinae]MBJ7556958.1 ABC-F family ATP-binding cassette domain-containing protein [Marinomonas spartinae]
MSLISVIELSYQAGSKHLFDSLSFSIESGDRIGLVGHNGCGKSTLLKLLLGELTLDSGQLHRQRGLKIGLVEQFLSPELEAISAHQAVLDNIPADEQVVRGYQVDTLLQQLGFDEATLQRPLNTLSGGQKNLVLFARAIIQEPELLLLDEPGNHMDSQAMYCLKRYLSLPDTPSFLMISHDRDLLDSVTQRTLWLRDGRCYAFHLPYSQAKVALAESDEAARKTREAEEKEIDKLKASAKRLATWGKVYDNEDLARKAKSMEKRIDKLEINKTFVTQGSGLSLKVDSEFLKTKQVFVFENETISSPDGRPLFSIADLNFRPGDRIALLGVNGSGKSSCIEHLIKVHQQNVGEQSTTRFNPNVRIGYFDQELEQFNVELGIADWIRQNCTASQEEIRRVLIQWGFPYLDHGRRVNVLSGGERARILLLTFLLEQPNLLIMDEPTNHIDLQGKEELESDLTQEGISLLFTSHDQRFIENIATRFWWIHNGQLVELHDSDVYFTSQGDDAGSKPSAFTDASPLFPEESVATAAMTEDERILERICELERLLEEDLARKPKRQKPAKQQQWQKELNVLNQQLE